MNFLILKDGLILIDLLLILIKKLKNWFYIAHTLRDSLPQSLAGTEQVLTVRLHGVIFQTSISFAAHGDYILKVCSQCIFLLKQLHAQGMPPDQLHTVFQAVIPQS